MSAYFLSDGVGQLAEIPCHDPSAFQEAIVTACLAGGRMVALTVIDERGPYLLGVVAHDRTQRLQALRMAVPEDQRYPSLAARLPQAQAFEREVAEDFGLLPEKHPWLKPLRRHVDLESPGTPDAHSFFQMQGEGVHEVAVGPVHAGIIEPGHFRFQCYGETVHSLEIQLGYQHRGAEKLLLGAAPVRRMAIAESVAGDTSIGHGLGYVTVMEKLAGIEVPVEAHVLRGLALELERVASHTGDLGALCNDVGYQPGAAWYGRLRGDFLNLLVELSGNRFGRGLLVPGGVRASLPSADRVPFLAGFATALADFERIADVIFDAPSVESRFARTGCVSAAAAEELGLVGPAARACGLDRDARRDHPEGIYRFAPVPVATGATGDVMARAEIRRTEVGHSASFIVAQLAALTGGPIVSPLPPQMHASSLAVAVIEGWRGEIVHVATTTGDGKLASYKIVDPSFHNWFGLAMAMRGEQISDFPLCNKSFDLSYAGHDL